MPDGFTKEEHKMINESKKILHDNEIEIIPTCKSSGKIELESLTFIKKFL